MRYLLLCLLLAFGAPSLAEPWRVVGDAQFAPYSVLPRVLVEMPRYVALAKHDRQRAELFAATLQRGHSPGASLQRWEQ